MNTPTTPRFQITHEWNTHGALVMSAEIEDNNTGFPWIERCTVWGCGEPINVRDEKREWAADLARRGFRPAA